MMFRKLFNISEERLKILSNIIWLFLDKMVNKGLGLLIIIWIARNIGSEDFGLWNYAIAFVTMFSVLSTLGLNSIVVRELVKTPEKENQILGTSLLLKFGGGILTVLVSFITILWFNKSDQLLHIVVLLIGLTYVMKAFDVIEFYFLSQVKSKYVVMARTSAFAIAAIFNITFILSDFELIYFVLVSVGEVLLGVIFMIFVFLSRHKRILDWRFNKGIAKQLMRDGAPLILAEIAILIYMRVDQIMIGKFIDNGAVGIYSAAVKLSEMWMLIPFIVTRSTFPKIVENRENNPEAYYRNLQKIFNLLAFIAIAVGLVILVLKEQIIWIVYGEEYIKAAGILSIHIWAAAFAFLGFVSSLWFTAENLQKYILYRTSAGAIFNILLNFIMIPKYGITGAAFATLIAQFVASYFFNLFTRQTLIIFKMQSISILNALTLNIFQERFANWIAKQTGK